MSRPIRSLLFVPGSRPDRWEKAMASGADAVCIDLEDAVIPADKAAARAGVMAMLDRGGDWPCIVGVRINALDTADGFRDVSALADRDVLPDMIMVPKAAGMDALANMGAALGLDDTDTVIWAVVETPEGLATAAEVGLACPDGGLLFGGADYSAAIGTTLDWEPLFGARSTLVNEAARAEVALMDVPYLDVSDTDGLRTSTERVRDMGFSARACIHPSQVAVVNAVFSPTETQVAWARAVIAAEAESDGNAVLLNGKLLDAPVYTRARRILDMVD